MKIPKYSTLTLGILSAMQVQSAGFQVAEHSATGLGRAFAGEAAVADNAAVLARNPAAMTLFDKAQLSAKLTLIDPDIDVWDRTNDESAHDIAPAQLVPGTYYVRPLTDEWAFGFGMFTTYGLETDYPDDIQAGDLAGDTSLLSVNLNPSVAYRISDHLSIGAGANLVYAMAELTRHKGALAPFLGGNTEDNLIALEGDAVGGGWNVGILYEVNQDHRFGFGYRSDVKLVFEEGEFKSYDTGIGTEPTVDGRLEINLPAFWEISGFHQLTPSFALHYSYMRTDWGTFTELEATSPDCTNTDGTVGQCFFKDEDYSDNERWSIGATYTFPDEKWIGRVGLAFDEQAGEATLSIPDSDRYWYSVGATYLHNEQISIDAALTLILSKDGSFEETDALGSELEFDAEGKAYIAAIQMNYTF